MKATYRYLRVVLKHKWFVILASRRVGVPLWRALIHDLSKLRPSEFFAYRDHFYKPPSPYAQVELDLAWMKHQNRNPHHWEYWIDRPHGRPQPMPTWAIREMVADWMAAGRAYDGYWPSMMMWPWGQSHLPRILGHMDRTSQVVLLQVLQEAGLLRGRVDS